MSIARRLAELEAEAHRQGFDELSKRMAARIATKSDDEIKAISHMLETYMRTGHAMPGLEEIIREMTAP